jgi:hypothetical protein
MLRKSVLGASVLTFTTMTALVLSLDQPARAQKAVPPKPARTKEQLDPKGQAKVKEMKPSATKMAPRT